jgi:hypothetical protein
MTRFTWWMRLVGLLYVLNGVMMAFVRAPIRSAGPAGALDRASAGDPMARFLVDTWMGFGLEVIAIGVVMLVLSNSARPATALAWTVIGIEIGRGIVYDLYMILRGYPSAVYVPWLVIHAVVIVTGLWALKSLGRVERRQTDRIAV